MSATLDLERPLRHPDAGSAPLMTKRARWLVVLGFFLPGSAQVLAGSKKLGRFGLGITFTLIGLLLLAAVGFFVARTFTLTIATNTIVLLLLQGLLIAYAIFWLVLGFNTLKLARIPRVATKWRLPIAILSILLTVVPSVGAVWASTAVGAGRAAISSIFGGGAPAVAPVDGRYNILLLGTDAGADREGLRPDSISLISVDAETGQSVVVGLPRELQNMPFPETSPMYAAHPSGFGADWGCNVGLCYLNGVYAEAEYFTPELYPDATSRGSSPGIEATKDAVSGATGLEVQFYVLIDMEGFAKLIDALGGVQIDVKEQLPIGGQIDENTGELYGVVGWIEPGLQTLDGFTAEWYARSRYGSARGDYDRMDRQRELQAAILAQANPANVLMRFQELAAAGTNLVETDIPESMLGRFVDLASKAKNHTPVNVQLTPPEVDPEYPDYAQIHQLVLNGIAAASPPPAE